MKYVVKFQLGYIHKLQSHLLVLLFSLSFLLIKDFLSMAKLCKGGRNWWRCSISILSDLLASVNLVTLVLWYGSSFSNHRSITSVVVPWERYLSLSRYELTLSSPKGVCNPPKHFRSVHPFSSFQRNKTRTYHFPQGKGKLSMLGGQGGGAILWFLKFVVFKILKWHALFVS